MSRGDTRDEAPADTGRAGGERLRVVIVGGGYTGAVLAFHLARSSGPAGPRILVVEPRETLGAGLAYSTGEPSHRINVPASRITMRTDVSDGFQRWIEEKDVPLDAESEAGDGALYPQRGLVADYIADALAGDLESGRIVHRRARATALTRAGTLRLTLDDGDMIEADHLVVATSHPPPELPAAFADLADDPRLVADPSDAGAIEAVARTAGNVLVLGTGLTSADVIASLDRHGFAGQLTAISRRGQRSRGHASGYEATTADFAEDPSRTVLDLLVRVRAAVRADGANGLPWQAALDRVRTDAPAIWAALPEAERRRFLRHLRPWWDVHRFRVAPQVEAVLDRLVAEGRLGVRAGRIAGVTAEPDGLAVSWSPRGDEMRRDLFDRVILTTGPGHGSILATSTFLASAARAGLVANDRLKLGLSVAQNGQALDASGSPVPGVWVAGPLARGTVGELMGIPEVTHHAETVAEAILEAQARR
ncbi:hypothetical protein DYI37_15000 [Fulvimarina endophytica]|uniref:FAD-dependent urate hydroxylase HpyO/Asp monooxygenase CreE-like FAD/NAD(P)-binding domain-containing protein n=1 Tax=Fulvimarina endophytica TaxID=2293836 RepID=A0A371X001_9HYPH|nr:FAD/NAD(P)-binding protein [Fulvimarina endophytica]RFC62558.1 hypothetical protein DYI37_15000 [Fulvimarina endophytica]